MNPRASRRIVIGSLAALVAGPAAYLGGRALLNRTGGVEPGPSGSKLLDAARKQKGVTTQYDAGYSRIAYPLGDVPRIRGACSDVIVRAARDGFGLDLQRLVHEDMVKAFAAYPQRWGLSGPDANIDHRRVPNLETWWRRQGVELSLGRTGAFPLPLKRGDIVTFLSVENRPHIALIAEPGPHPRILHNIGLGVREEPLSPELMAEAHGHYRWPEA